QTDNDWNGIQLSLVSGRPISFVQDLYQPLYIPRPVVQPELFASLRPQTYEAGMEMKKEALAATNENMPGGGAVQQLARRRQLAAAPAAEARAGLVGQSAANSERELADKPIDASASIASVAAATKIGELFQYRIENTISL